MDTDRLDEALHGRSPLADSLRPGRDRGGLVAVRVDGHGLPNPVVEWFAWHDGADGVDELVPGGRPLALDHAVAIAAARREAANRVARDVGIDAPIGWQDGWLPLLTHHQEERCWVVDCGRADPQVLLVDIEDPDPATAHESVAAMVEAITAGWTSGEWTADDGGRVRVASDRHGEQPADSTILDGLYTTDEDEVYDATLAIEANLTPGLVPGFRRAAVEAPLPWTRTRAVELLARIGGRDAEAALHDVLATAPDTGVRETAAAFLDPYDTPATADALVVALDDPAPAVRAKAAYSFAGMASSITAVHLEALETHRAAADPEVAKAIDYTLGALRRGPTR